MKRPHPIILLLSAVIPSNGQDVTLTAGFAGTNKANGNIFTIKSKSSQSISIESFDINMDGPPSPSPAPIEVYFLPDTDPGFQSSNYQYTKIFDGDIAGEGNGNVTSLPEFTNPVVIPPGATYSFYITVASFQLGTNLHYNIGSQVGSVVASDANLEIGEGWALAYPFLGYSANRRWNGNVMYAVGGAPPPSTTPNPTLSPTPKPTPTPVVSGDQPVQQPTDSPITASPTMSSTPVNNPTTSPVITSKPTNSPVAPTTPTNDDGGGSNPTPTPPPSSNPTNKPTTLRPTTRKPTSSDEATGAPSTTVPTIFTLGPTEKLNQYLPTKPTKNSSSMKNTYTTAGVLLLAMFYLSF